MFLAHPFFGGQEAAQQQQGYRRGAPPSLQHRWSNIFRSNLTTHQSFVSIARSHTTRPNMRVFWILTLVLLSILAFSPEATPTADDVELHEREDNKIPMEEDRDRGAHFCKHHLKQLNLVGKQIQLSLSQMYPKPPQCCYPFSNPAPPHASP